MLEGLLIYKVKADLYLSALTIKCYQKGISSSKSS